MSTIARQLRKALASRQLALVASGRSHRLPQKDQRQSIQTALGPAPTATAAAPTATITADPLAIDLGQSVVLNWRTQNATVVTIDGIGQVNLNGTQTVSPSNSTNFHLTAKGDGGTTEANVRVTVRVPVAPTAPPTEPLRRHGLRSSLPPERPGRLLRLRQLRPPSRRPGSTAQAAGLSRRPPRHQGRHRRLLRRPRLGRVQPRLGENRANAARTALVTAGVAASRLRVISYGKEKQFCTEENETCWQQNRRAQFSLDR